LLYVKSAPDTASAATERIGPECMDVMV
jgi:hypothetical protein